MEDLVSVVVPVYNVEKYLERCIESILSQTYTKLEIILIDDGATDQSGKMCDVYANRDKRIRVIHKKNGGLSDARNAGIEIASGKYITFIDSDDYVSDKYVETLLKLLIECDADISCISFKRFEGEKVEEPVPKDEKKIFFDGIEAIKDMWYQKHISNSACGKMYTRRLFEKVRYPVGRLYEDLGTTYKLFFGTEKVVWSSTVLYFYFHRRESIMNQCFHEKKMDRITVSIELLNWAEKQCKEVLTAAQVRFFVSNMQVLREIPNRDEYRDEIANIRKNIAKYRRKVICNRKAKFLVRVIAVCSVLDMRILQKMGTVYKIVEHRGGKL